LINKVNNRPVFVFDFGGVLIDWDPRYLYQRYFNGDLEAAEHFLDEIGFFEWNLQLDAGRPLSKATNELCKQFPQYCDLIQAYDLYYPESIRGPIQPTLDILRRLKQNDDSLFALSNWPAEKFYQVRHKYNFFEWFDGIIISGEVKMIKPDYRIFQLLLKMVARPAEECLFIDDAINNIQVAKELGFQTIHFESAKKLADTLNQMGLYPITT
jgi:2-haloacid dehalogenase